MFDFHIKILLNHKQSYTTNINTFLSNELGDIHDH